MLHPFFATLGAGVFGALSLTAQSRPNILIILCDDMGYGDLGCYGQRLIVTPHIDRLAAEGMRFTQAYAGSPVSAPSRATLMTGQHTGHTHVRGNREYWREHFRPRLYGQHTEVAEGWAGQEPYDTLHPILPEIFKAHNYSTGMFGKWAGGYESSASTPDRRGIDEFFGFICQFQAHSYYPNFLNAFSRSAGDRHLRRVALEENIPYGMPGTPDYAHRPQYASDLIHRKALEWLDRQDDTRPFLGIFTYTLPHAELAQPNDSILAAYDGFFSPERHFAAQPDSRYHGTENAHAQYAAMVTRLDKQVGEIMTKLREKGWDRNTIVVFTSDNGPHTEGGADPRFFHRDPLLRGTKRSTHEGGIRVPFIVRWVGHVPAGRANDHPLAFYDLLPTFCQLADIADFPESYTARGISFDGISFAPTLSGRTQEQPLHDVLYWEFHETDMMAVRQGDWKLIVEKGRCRLYNLANDIHEDRDLAADHPERVKQLAALLRREHRPHPLFPVTLPIDTLP